MMSYKIITEDDINLNQGDNVEILESYYRKYSDEIVVSKLNINGHIYRSEANSLSAIDFLPVKRYIGHVMKVTSNKKEIFIDIEPPQNKSSFGQQVLNAYTCMSGDIIVC